MMKTGMHNDGHFMHWQISPLRGDGPLYGIILPGFFTTQLQEHV
jgi:hypothetical protein